MNATTTFHMPRHSSPLVSNAICLVRVLMAMIMLLCTTTFAQTAHAAATETDVEVTWRKDPASPTLNTSVATTLRLRMNGHVIFSDPVLMDGTVTRMILRAPQQGRAWIDANNQSIHFSAENAEAGTYTFTVQHTNEWGHVLDVEHTAIVVPDAAGTVSDAVESVGGMLRKFGALASTGSDSGHVFLLFVLLVVAALEGIWLRRRYGCTHDTHDMDAL